MTRRPDHSSSHRVSLVAMLRALLSTIVHLGKRSGDVAVPRHASRRSRRLGPVALFTAAFLVASAGAAAAYFSTTDTGPGGAEAGAIAAPTNFHASSAFPNQATLSWTAPSAPSPTGYTLSGSVFGTGSTCAATLGGAVTSCTVKGLTQGTKYTWTLTARDHTWVSTAVTATATTATPAITLTPVSGTGGTVVSVTGNGFAATSALTFSFTPSGGTAVGLTPTNCTPTTTSTGTLPAAPCKVTIPTNPTTGAGTITVTDASSNSATATFTVTSGPTGVGTITVTPTTAVASATHKSFQFDYTAGTGGLTNGVVTITVPSGWTAPSSTKTAGYVSFTPTVTAPGTLAVTGSTIKVSGLTLSSGSSFSVIYGFVTGTATGVTVPSTLGPYTFTTKEASTAAGTPSALTSQPVVTVVAACKVIAGAHSLAVGATTHFVIKGASGASGGNGGGAGAGGTVISGTLKNNGSTAVTLTYVLGCKGTAGGVPAAGTGGNGYGSGTAFANGGNGGAGHSTNAGGGGGGGGASALTFKVGATTTIVGIAAGGGGGAGKNGSKGGHSAIATKVIAATTALFSGGAGTSPGNNSAGGTGGGGGGGGVHASAPGGKTGTGGTGGTSDTHSLTTVTGIAISNISVTTGTSGATASVTFSS